MRIEVGCVALAACALAACGGSVDSGAGGAGGAVAQVGGGGHHCPLGDGEATHIVALSGTYEAVAALTNTGDVYFWGRDYSGETANPETNGATFHAPVRSPYLECVVEVSMSGQYGCARDIDDDVVCFGDPPEGMQGGIIPQSVPGFLGATGLATGALAGVSTSGQAIIAGRWSGSLSPAGSLVQDPPGWPHGEYPRFATLPTTGGPNCGIDPDGYVWCFGQNELGQVGDGTLDFAVKPVRVLDLPTAAQLGRYGDRACARLDSGRLACWGRGPLGDGSTLEDSTPSPVMVEGLTGVVDVALGSASVCAIADEGVACWGWVGGSLEPYPQWIQVDGTFMQVAALAGAGCALRDDHEVFCWGQSTIAGYLDDGSYPPHRIVFPFSAP